MNCEEELEQINRSADRGLAFLSGLIVGVVVAGLAAGIGNYRNQRKAIEAGAARWVCDPNTGVTEFEYIKRDPH